MGIGKWFKNQMFDGKILRTTGTVQGNGKSMVKMEVKVHQLEGKTPGESRLVGLELVAKSALSYQMLPCTLSIGAARRLADLIQSAASG